jgi:hypothetical protein
VAIEIRLLHENYLSGICTRALSPRSCAGGGASGTMPQPVPAKRHPGFNFGYGMIMLGVWLLGAYVLSLLRGALHALVEKKAAFFNSRE